MIRNLMSDTLFCPDGYRHYFSARSDYCIRCGYSPVLGDRETIHIEKGTPSQIINAWDRLAREDERPS